MRLKELRKEKGLSQLRLATDLHTTQNTISRYETGERKPGIAELIKIADYFNVSVDYLIGRTDCPRFFQIVPLRFSIPGKPRPNFPLPAAAAA